MHCRLSAHVRAYTHTRARARAHTHLITRTLCLIRRHKQSRRGSRRCLYGRAHGTSGSSHQRPRQMADGCLQETVRVHCTHPPRISPFPVAFLLRPPWIVYLRLDLAVSVAHRGTSSTRVLLWEQMNGGCSSSWGSRYILHRRICFRPCKIRLFPAEVILACLLSLSFSFHPSTPLSVFRII
jgi:hypothetical protein